MPTDPFVSPELEDAPRHKQNLPPGVALPPARAWKAERPGELGPGQPAGPLLGSPGPNVGYALGLVHRARSGLRLAPHEHADDAASVVAALAMRRAALFGRAPVGKDVEVAGALLGYDGSADAEFAERRAALTHEAAHSYTRRRGVVDAVPDDLLRAQPADLAPLAARWRTSLAAAAT